MRSICSRILSNARIDPLALGLGVFGHDMLDRHARLVEHGMSDREPLTSVCARAVGADQVIGHAQHVLVVDQFAHWRSVRPEPSPRSGAPRSRLSS
jgi:hypothetical protein